MKFDEVSCCMLLYVAVGRMIEPVWSPFSNHIIMSLTGTLSFSTELQNHGRQRRIWSGSSMVRRRGSEIQVLDLTASQIVKSTGNQQRLENLLFEKAL
jgi:hypothetical protein